MIRFASKKTFTILILLCISLLFVFNPLKAHVASPEDQASKLKTILIGIDPDTAPYVSMSINNQPEGLFVDMLNLLAKDSNIRIEYLPLSMGSNYHNLKTGNLDAILGVHYSEKHSDWISYSDPFYAYSTSSYTLKNTDEDLCLECNPSGKIGIIANRYPDDYISDQFPKLNKAIFSTNDSMMKATLEGKLESFIMADPIANFMIKKYNRDHDFKKHQTPLFYRSIHIAFKKGQKELLSLFNLGLKNLNKKTLITLEEKWVKEKADRYFSNFTFSKKLSKEELKWIQENPKIDIPIIHKPPFSYFDGEIATGMAIEHVKLMLKKVQLVPNFKGYYTSLKQVVQSESFKEDFQLIPAVDTKSNFKNELHLTKHIFEYPFVIVTQRNSELVSNLTDIEGHSLAIQHDSSLITELRKGYPNIKLLIYQNVADALRAVATGQATAFIGNLATATYFIDQIQLTNLKIAAPSPFPPKKVSIGINKDHPILHSIVSKASASMTSVEHKDLKNRWMILKYEYGISAKEVFYWVSGTIIIAACILIFILTSNRKLQIEIFERQKVEKKLQKAKLEAENASKVKSEFLANISHEIRTPLNSILGFSNLLSSHEDDFKKLQYIHAIDSSGKALLTLINELLDYTKSESGKITLNLSTVHLPSLLLEIQQLFYPKYSEKNLTYSTHYPENQSEFFALDSSRLRQVLVNLIGNAIKFTEKGSISATVDVKNSNGNKVDLLIQITDTGIGIEQDQQKRIFKAFEQHKGQNPSQFYGTGLGLAISRNLTRLMGGKLSVKSKPGEGSCFSIRLTNILIKKYEKESILKTPTLDSEIQDSLKTISKISADQVKQKQVPVNYLIMEKLVPLLKEEYRKKWVPAKKTMNINDIEALAKATIELGKQYSFSPVVDWGNRILKDIDSFNIDQIANTIDTFPVLLENLQSRMK